ncbi:homoserine kinase [Paradesulfitobacterium ferrireducens]|uniref:homoserine kinase n=1 Tax=Paradesulfitobacterium ferrireducens TaxID=2816476 RepID=UPI001A8C469E|nr:homoserine kinase [Paradesulfitobacterium ferrireducens]
MKVEVRVPATSANLGPGFDCLGLALSLYNTITVETEASANSLKIKCTGPYAEGITTDESNLVWKTMLHLWHSINFPIPSVTLTLDIHIPPARGLGSSSTAIVGGLLAANAVAGNLLTQNELLQMANALEGHPDNVAPALFGGVTLSVPTENGVHTRILARSPKLTAIAVVPEILVKTEKARAVLKPEVSRKDAVFNIAHVGLIVEAFLTENYELLHEGMRDKLHQDQRAALIPGMHTAIAAALEAGAYGAALSGSGPTLIALSPAVQASRIAAGMRQSLTKKALDVRVYTLEVDANGASIAIP